MSEPEKKADPIADIWDGMTDIAKRITALSKRLSTVEARPDVNMRVGAARPLAATERATTWREIEINGAVFRVMTIEDEQA